MAGEITTKLQNLMKLIKSTWPNFIKIEFAFTQSTGLRNPSLYELYGNNGRTDAYKHVANPDADPQTNEVKIRYFLRLS